MPDSEDVQDVASLGGEGPEKIRRTVGSGGGQGEEFRHPSTGKVLAQPEDVLRLFGRLAGSLYQHRGAGPANDVDDKFRWYLALAKIGVAIAS